MHIETYWRALSGRGAKCGLRKTAPFLLAALATGAVLFFLESNPDIRLVSDATLEDLVRAQSHLDESYGPREDLLSERKAVNHELSEALQLVTEAERADPSIAGETEDLRADLHALEAGRDAAPATMTELDAGYEKVRTELKSLIDERIEGTQ